jgi:ferredoxin
VRCTLIYVFTLISIADVISLCTGCADHINRQESAFVFNGNTLPSCHVTASFFRSNAIRGDGGIMRVKIDYDLCMGDRNCNKVCPEVFQYDEDQLISRVLVDEVPKNLEELVRKAARECAPGAISIEE